MKIVDGMLHALGDLFYQVQTEIAGRQVLNNVNLTVKAGEIAMLVGRNGCGKSTLMKVIRGIIDPTIGSVDLSTPCAFVDQDPDRQIVMPTVADDVKLFLRLPRGTSGEEATKKASQCLELVGLQPADRYLAEGSFRLSGGERQRVAVASAIASNPKVLLMDEITASMDIENRHSLLANMRRIVSRSQVAALWITHHLIEEIEVADSLYVMKEGRLRQVPM